MSRKVAALKLIKIQQESTHFLFERANSASRSSVVVGSPSGTRPCFYVEYFFPVALFKHEEHQNSVLLTKTPREAVIDGRRSVRGVSAAPYPRFSSLPTLRAKLLKELHCDT